MRQHGGRAHAAEPKDKLWGEALRRWYEQEQASLPPLDEGVEPEYDRPFPPGWWILPSFLMSLAIWAVIGWMAFT